jgi:hypothetical protein
VTGGCSQEVTVNGRHYIEDRLRFDSIDSGVGGLHGPELAIGVLGVLVITGEYATRMLCDAVAAAAVGLVRRDA